MTPELQAFIETQDTSNSETETAYVLALDIIDDKGKRTAGYLTELPGVWKAFFGVDHPTPEMLSDDILRGIHIMTFEELTDFGNSLLDTYDCVQGWAVVMYTETHTTSPLTVVANV